MAEQKKQDAWMLHMEKYGLVKLDAEAQQVGYRVRTANDWQFEMELQANLPRYNVAGSRIKTCDMTEVGKAQARAFLAEVRAYIVELKAGEE